MRVLLFANVGTDENGYYHVGDEAMFLEMIRWYRTCLPTAQLSALVSLPLQYGTHIQETRGLGWPDTKDKALLYFLKLTFKTFVLTRFHVSLFTPEQKTFIEYLDSQEVIHFTGGGNLTSECGHWFYYALFVAVASRLLGKPVILTSQTIGPFSSWIDEKMATWILNMVQSITLREYSGEQQKWLKHLGLIKPRISRSLDMAYFLPPSHVIEDTHFDRNMNTIRVGLALHSRKNNAQQLKNMVVETLKQLAQTHEHLEVILLPHILNAHSDWDTKFLEEIALELPASIRVLSPKYASLVKNKAHIAHFVKECTGTCDVVISSRYHGVIFSLSQSVPCISITDGKYQTMKNLEALRFLFGEDAEKFLVSLDELSPQNVLAKKLYTILSSRHRIHTYLLKRNTTLRSQQQKYLTCLAKEVRLLA